MRCRREEAIPLLSYLGITYKKNEIVNDVLNWFEGSMDFLNYCNPYQELKAAISRFEEVKTLVFKMIQKMEYLLEKMQSLINNI